MHDAPVNYFRLRRMVSRGWWGMCRPMRVTVLSLLLLLGVSGAVDAVPVLSSATRAVVAGRNSTSSDATGGIFAESVSDAFLLCQPPPVGCFDSLGSASASQTSEIASLAWTASGEAHSAGEFPPAGMSTFGLSFELLTPHKYTLSGTLVASTSSSSESPLARSAIFLVGPDLDLNFLVAPGNLEPVMSEEVHDARILLPGIYEFMVTADAPGSLFSGRQAQFDLSLILTEQAVSEPAGFWTVSLVLLVTGFFVGTGAGRGVCPAFARRSAAA